MTAARRIPGKKLPAPVTAPPAAETKVTGSAGETAVETVDVPPELTLEQRFANQSESLTALVDMNNAMVGRLRQCVSAMQIAQMLVGEIAKGDQSTMTPRPDLQQVLDVLNTPIKDNYHVSRGMSMPG